ncbi:hypothetical protein SDJN03_07009, partial [Cucurbita argyrosperma subsp. sororia]
MDRTLITTSYSTCFSPLPIPSAFNHPSPTLSSATLSALRRKPSLSSNTLSLKTPPIKQPSSSTTKQPPKNALTLDFCLSCPNLRSRRVSTILPAGPPPEKPHHDDLSPPGPFPSPISGKGQLSGIPTPISDPLRKGLRVLPKRNKHKSRRRHATLAMLLLRVPGCITNIDNPIVATEALDFASSNGSKITACTSSEYSSDLCNVSFRSAAAKRCLRCRTVYSDLELDKSPSACAFPWPRHWGEWVVFVVARRIRGLTAIGATALGVIVYKWNDEGQSSRTPAPATGRDGGAVGALSMMNDALLCRRGWHVSYDDGFTCVLALSFVSSQQWCP